MFPAGKPAKSAASQPLVEVLPRPSCRSTAVTGGGHVTGVGLVDHAEVDVLDVGHRVGRRLLERRRADLGERQVVERLDDRVVAGGLEPLDHVVDRRVVARQAGEPVAAVGVGDGLEGRAGARAPGRA